jgi:hypothetical protein
MKSPCSSLSTSPTPFRRLLAGLDTVECAYYLAPLPGGALDFGWFGVQKERLRHSKRRDPLPVALGGMEFLLQPYGSSSGYPFVLTNPDYTIAFGEVNSPSFFVKFSSLALWRKGAVSLHQRFLAWAGQVGLEAHRPESLSRVDFTFDYGVPVIDFDEDSFVSLSAKDTQYRQDGQIQTFVLGKGDVVLRVYDKVAEIREHSGKTWFFELWGEQEHVWRIEWQVRKALLRRFAIRTVDDLISGPGDVLRYLVEEHDSLRIQQADRNRSRWPIHPLWVDVLAQVQSWSMQGVYRDIDAAALLEERLMRLAISVYGYLKRVAAVHCLQEGKPMLGHDDALNRLEILLDRLHDPLTWEADVSKRITQMRLGQ